MTWLRPRAQRGNFPKRWQSGLIKSIGCACAYEDVSDEKSSQPWLCTDHWPGRRAARRAIVSTTVPTIIPKHFLPEKRLLVSFPIRNRHQKAPRGAMLVKMAGFPYVHRVGGTWVGFSKNTITCALIFQTKFLGVILTKGLIFQIVMFSSSSSKILYLLGSKDWRNS